MSLWLQLSLGLGGELRAWKTVKTGRPEAVPKRDDLILTQRNSENTEELYAQEYY